MRTIFTTIGQAEPITKPKPASPPKPNSPRRHTGAPGPGKLPEKSVPCKSPHGPCE